MLQDLKKWEQSGAQLTGGLGGDVGAELKGGRGAGEVGLAARSGRNGCAGARFGSTHAGSITLFLSLIRRLTHSS